MMGLRIMIRIGVICVAALLAGCATNNNNLDYTAFRQSKPASILILPPLNDSVEPDAAAAVLSQATFPLAESGYYVFPVAVVAETFKQNGLITASDIQAVPPTKLRKIFGADAALYLDVHKYGSSYAVFSSAITVDVSATLIDLRTGKTLWSGKKVAVESSGGVGLIGMLVQAVVSQIANTLSGRSYKVAGMADQQLLLAGQPGGILYGPRSPKYEPN